MEGTVGKGDKPLIELNNIHKIYQMGGESVHANDGISLTICRGEFVAIVGKSGSGKSTLMNIIGALDVPTSGEYFLGGEDVSDMEDGAGHGFPGTGGVKGKMEKYAIPAFRRPAAAGIHCQGAGGKPLADPGR